MERGGFLEGLAAAALGGLSGSLGREKPEWPGDEDQVKVVKELDECWGMWLQEGSKEELPMDSVNYTVEVEKIYDRPVFGEIAELRFYDQEKDESYGVEVIEGHYITLPIGYLEVEVMPGGTDEGFVSLRYNEGC